MVGALDWGDEVAGFDSRPERKIKTQAPENEEMTGFADVTIYKECKF